MNLDIFILNLYNMQIIKITTGKEKKSKMNTKIGLI